MWCCKPKSTRQVQVPCAWCTQADFERGCKQMRDCVCPPSEGEATMKVAMKNQEKSVGVTYESQVGSKQCRWCDCIEWNEPNYSQCSPIANQEAGSFHTVRCREDGITPMPGHWTSHD